MAKLEGNLSRFVLGTTTKLNQKVSSVLSLDLLHEDVNGSLRREARPEGLHHERLLPDGGRPVDQRHLSVLVDVQLAQGHIDQVLAGKK